MAVKYICPLCGRRFVDWGAEKLEFKCPTPECKDETLVLLGSVGDDQNDKPSLKRSKKRKAILPTIPPDIADADMDEAFIEPADVDDEEEEELEEDEVAAVAVAVAVPVDDDEVDGNVLLVDDGDVDDEEDGTFTDALDIGSDEIVLDDD